MPSKTSCSKNSLLRRCLGRYWPAWLGMVAVLALTLVIPVASDLSYVARREHLIPAALRALARDTVYTRIPWTALYVAVFVLAAAMVVFEHTYSAKLSGLFAALPVRREKLFLQHWLAGAVMLLSTGLFVALALLAVEAVYGAAHPASVFSWFAFYAMESLALYGIAVFCVMLTGHVLVIPALFVLVNIAGSVLNVLLTALVDIYTYGVVDGMNHFEWMHALSPFVELINQIRPAYNAGESGAVGMTGWAWAAAYCAVGLVLTALAMLLFKNRQLERAQDTTAFPILRPILKYIVTVFFALGFPFLVLFFFSGFNLYARGGEGARFFPAHLLLTVLGTVIGYFLSEMIIHKSIRVFSRRGWLKALAVAAACCGVVCLFRYDGFGLAKRVPAPETVTTAVVNVGEAEYRVDTPDGIAAVETLHREIIARQAETEAKLAQASANPEGAGGRYVDLAYELENGSLLSRGYFIPVGALLDQVEDTLNHPAVASRRIELSPPVPMDRDHVMSGEVYGYEGGYLELTGAEALAFYEEAILPDCQAGAYSGQIIQYDEAYLSTHYATSISIYLKIDAQTGETLTYHPSVDTVNTNAWLTAHGVPLVLQSEADG